MPDNRDVDVAQAYHDATKHSYASVRNNPHYLDFENQPLPFKIYPTLEPSPLPAEVRQTGVAALSAISKFVAPGQSSARRARPGTDRPASIPLGRHHSAPEISRRRNLLSRRCLHRSAL